MLTESAMGHDLTADVTECAAAVAGSVGIVYFWVISQQFLYRDQKLGHLLINELVWLLQQIP